MNAVLFHYHVPLSFFLTEARQVLVFILKGVKQSIYKVPFCQRQKKNYQKNHIVST
uniref:Uncharacterized protein n=1 Tax=Oryza brachyantha TaxID=4533 RepID=J3MB51_ORYBR